MLNEIVPSKPNPAYFSEIKVERNTECVNVCRSCFAIVLVQEINFRDKMMARREPHSDGIAVAVPFIIAGIVLEFAVGVRRESKAGAGTEIAFQLQLVAVPRRKALAADKSHLAAMAVDQHQFARRWKSCGHFDQPAAFQISGRAPEAGYVPVSGKE